MSGDQRKDQAAAAVRAAASAAGDVSGNCDEAVHWLGRGDVADAAERLEWAEENAQSALHRIREARGLLAKLAA